MSFWPSFERFRTSCACTPLVKSLGLCSVDCDERKTTPSEAVLLKQSRSKALRLWIGRLPFGKPEHHHIGQNLARDASEQERLEGREGTTRQET